MCTLLPPMPPGSIRWRSGSIASRNKPYAGEPSAASKNWSRKSIATFKIPTATQGHSSGPPQQNRSLLKSSDYVKVFPGQHTSSQVSDFPRGLNGSSQHSRKACLQEFQNATFFEGTELTACTFKQAKNQPFSLQRTRKVRTKLQNHLFIRNFQNG